MAWPNDHLANAEVLSGAAGSVGPMDWPGPVAPTAEAGEAGGGLPSIWYRWQAPGSGTFTFTTDGSTGSSRGLDTILRLYSGPTGASYADLVFIAENDDDATLALVFNSSITFTATAGTVYYLQLSTYANEVGQVLLTWMPPLAPPANDTFAGRLPLTPAVHGSAAVTVAGATVEAWETGPSASTTVWYEWVAPFTGIVLFRFPASPDLGSLEPSLYVGPLVDGHPVFSKQAQTLSGFRMLYFDATAGTTYYLQVDAGFAGQQTGTLTWQRLEAIPEQVAPGSSLFYPTTTTIPNPQPDSAGVLHPSREFMNPPGVGQVATSAETVLHIATDRFGGSPYEATPSPHDDDASNVQFYYGPDDGLSPFLGVDLYGVSLSSVAIGPQDGLPPLPPTPIPADATVTSVLIFVRGRPGANYAAHDRARIAAGFRSDAGIALTASTDCPGGASIELFYGQVGLPVPLAGLPSIAALNAAGWEIVLGVKAADRAAAGFTRVSLVTSTWAQIDWTGTIGQPVPDWAPALLTTPPLRQVQRNDGLGLSAPRQINRSSRQRSLRQGPRTYR